MKILYLCSWYRENTESSEGVFFAEQAAVFARHGHEVAIAHCRKTTIRQLGTYAPFKVSRNEDYTSAVKGTVYRGEVVWPPSKYRGNPFFFRKFQYSRFLKKVFKDFGCPDVIHIQSALDAGILSYKYLVKQGIPYIFTEHSSRFLRKIVLPYQHKNLPRLCAESKHNFCVSHSLKKRLIEYGVTAPVSVLPNMVDEKVFCAPESKRYSDFTFLIAGNFKKNKRIDLAIEMFDKLCASYPGARLKIAGSGVEHGVLESLTSSLENATKISFLGRLDTMNLAAEMQRSHCLLSVSEYETFGLTIIEAMACGMYVVSTRSGGPDEIVETPYGELVDVNDSDSLYKAMVNAIEKVEFTNYSISERSTYAISKYGTRRLYQTLIQVYEKANSMNEER